MTAICPYPGLRPFAEEESIFFKGRDVHIREIVKMLEQNKMSFITGASGDGKSSMVFAGVLPFISAGFSKSEFNSWIFCSFTPQRNPLESLARTLSDYMQVPYDSTFDRLRHGFSGLVDVYKNSGFYVKEGNDAANRGKNLLIIADQFEEIFTMNENFHDGSPSNEAYTTVNLLLETVRLSIVEKLPVYVIFTMRSDYISQCTVFKDLPEFIAYSQFFVPPLKRTEILQVIEQPALLAGGSVSTRLTEVLINNLNSGFDYLPVLQHTLNLLWKTAQNGKVELDLIHLAKIAGISKDVLSEKEQVMFDAWFATRPEYVRKYFAKPDINNVLNAHAGTLYESAYDHFMRNAEWADKTITPEESKEIIEIAFKSLTKIDDNRLVRNRCSLHEITGIINKPNITEATVCGVLNIFRDENNTLLRPFAVKDELETQYLSGDTVLDVTHEALIRNWKLLSQWDSDELANLNEYNEFNALLQRWLDNGRNPEFLLPSGNYALFSTWYKQCKPNKYWILKHDTSQRPEMEKLRAATSRMEKIDTYMEQSKAAIVAQEKARKNKVITAICALLVFVLGLSLFSWWALSEKKKADIQTDRAEENAEMAERLLALSEERQRIADEQRHIAEDAQIVANQQRDSAQLMYQRARAAKLESDRARRRAEEAQMEAEQERYNAEYNFNLAQLQRDTAERERKNALHQMDLTKEANDNAAHLYYVALCNTLAMKAKNQYEDKTMNLRLAKTACDMNRKGGSSKINADLYDAMLFAMEQNNIIKPLNIDGGPFKAFTVDRSGHLVTFASDGTVSMYKVSGNAKAENISSYENTSGSKVPVESATFVTPTRIAYSTKDRKSYMADLNTQKRTPLPPVDDYLQSASLSPDAQKCAVAYIAGMVQIIPSNGGTPLYEKIFNIGVTDVFYHDDNRIYVLFHDGSLSKWNPVSGELKPVLGNTIPQHAFKMTAIRHKNILAVCYSHGDIVFVDMTADAAVKTMVGGHSKLENMLYDQASGILALSSADKRISLINTNDFDEKPLVIEEHSLGNRKVKCMAFNHKGVLFALTDDNKLRQWDTNPETYSSALAAMNLSPLSDTEWNLIMGREFSER